MVVLVLLLCVSMIKFPVLVLQLVKWPAEIFKGRAQYTAGMLFDDQLCRNYSRLFSNTLGLLLCFMQVTAHGTNLAGGNFDHCVVFGDMCSDKQKI